MQILQQNHFTTRSKPRNKAFLQHAYTNRRGCTFNNFVICTNFGGKKRTGAKCKSHVSCPYSYRVPTCRNRGWKWETRSQEGGEVLRYRGYLLRCRSRKGMSVDLVCYVVWKNRPWRSIIIPLLIVCCLFEWASFCIFAASHSLSNGWFANFRVCPLPSDSPSNRRWTIKFSWPIHLKYSFGRTKRRMLHSSNVPAVLRKQRRQTSKGESPM